MSRFPTLKPATYVQFYSIFARALKGQGEVPVKAEEARDVLQIIEAVKLSSKEERTVSL